MSSQVRCAAAIATVLLLEEEENEERRKRRKRSVWVREWILKRDRIGFCGTLLNELRNSDIKSYTNFVRMAPQDFDFLLEKLKPIISKQDTHMRKAISAEERLVITLRYLATGDSFHSLMYLFRVPVCTISKIVPEVCLAIYNVLKDEFLKIPSTTDEWESIIQAFNEEWNFPNCIGALDGKHIVIKAPPNSGSMYFNYKKCHSIILMALVDAKYKFTYVNVGSSGRNSDGGVFNNSSLGKSLENNTLNIPPDKPLPFGLQNVPQVIVADDAFAMQHHILKPFPQRNLQGAERVFNYRLSRAKRVSENVFGISSARFRVLRKPSELGPKKTTTIVLAICTLHNFLMSRRASKNIYAAKGDLDYETEGGVVVEGRWRNEDSFLNGSSLLPLQRKNSNDYKLIREIFKDYFMTDGELEWQYKHL